MIRDADPELWARLSTDVGSQDRWTQEETTTVIRDLRSDELEAVVAIGSMGRDSKAWESDLTSTICRVTQGSEASARQLINRLVANGFLEEVKDLDYSKQSEHAWCNGSRLWILPRAARRSGLFPRLPPPLPERLSRLLTYERPIEIMGREWYAVRFETSALTALDTNQLAIVTVVRLDDPARSWAFRSLDDRDPLTVGHSLHPDCSHPHDPLGLTCERNTDRASRSRIRSVDIR